MRFKVRYTGMENPFNSANANITTFSSGKSEGFVMVGFSFLSQPFYRLTL